MTTEDKKKLINACKLVKEVFPDMCGNVRFNLHTEREKVNCNIEYSIMIDPKEYFEVNQHLGKAIGVGPPGRLS